MPIVMSVINLKILANMSRIAPAKTMIMNGADFSLNVLHVIYHLAL